MRTERAAARWSSGVISPSTAILRMRLWARARADTNADADADTNAGEGALAAHGALGLCDDPVGAAANSRYIHGAEGQMT